MTVRVQLLESIAATIADYRAGDLAAPTPEHVERWAKQFDKECQLTILREMDFVLTRTYFSRKKVKQFLGGVLKTDKLVGTDRCAFWESVGFLDIQGGGNSQREMLRIFDKLLQKSCDITIADCGTKSTKEFIYLDDAIFTGNRVRRDIESWLQTDAPKVSKLHVISIAFHRGGRYYADKKIQTAAKAAGKKVEITWWRANELEDRLSSTNESDVLRPTTIPDVTDVKNYVEGMTHKPRLRVPGNVGINEFFSGEAGRNLLEQEFLKAGVRIRGMCPNLGDTQRPLGHISLESVGFGSLIVTFRNCPNNAPLALWVDDPWYPLFARTTNTATALRRSLIDDFDVF